jgi:LmbE family N-acetylglucosaminyl deacetylase
VTRLLGAFAHPDDDVYSLGATLVAHRGDLRSTFVFATSGENGPITDPAVVSRDELAPVREREQRASMEALGVADAVTARFLRLPDYYLPDEPFGDLVERLGDAIRDTRPDIIVTFGPDGMTGHQDHIRVGEAALAAFDGASDDTPTHLFQTALARSAVDRLYSEVDEAGDGPRNSLLNVAGVPDERISVRFDARPYRATKLEGILAHRTQLCEWERVPEPLRWIFLDEEAFVQARPAIDAGEPAADLLSAVERSG